MTTTVSLDKIDLKILQALQHNGRLSNVELSERVALSPSPACDGSSSWSLPALSVAMPPWYTLPLWHSAYRCLSAYP